MTIAVDPTRAASLAAANEENNPFVTGASLTPDTISTGVGTEVQAAANAFDGYTYSQWTATPGGGNFATLRLEFTVATEARFFAIAAHNIATIGGLVRVAYSTDGGTTWVDSGAGQVTPTDNQPIAWRFDPVTAADWRVLVTNITDDVSIGVAWIGDELVIDQAIYQGYAPPVTATEIDLQANVSQGAHLLGAAFVNRGSRFGARFEHIPATFIRGADWLAFQKRWNEANGAFWGWRPTKYGDLFYAWRDGAAIVPENTGPTDRMSFAIEGRANHDF